MTRKTKLWIAAVLFFVYGAITLYAGWFNGSARQAEAKLQQVVEHELAEANLTEVSVELNGQLAIISGTARSESQRKKIIDTVRSAKWSGGLISGGVTVVRADDLRVVSLPDTPITPFVWSAEKTEQGPIIMSGMVPDEASRQAIVAHARGQFPAGVIDRMSVARNAPAGDWVSAARLSLDTLGQLQSGRATGNGDKFNVTGKAASREIAKLAEDNMRDMPQGFRGQPNITAPEPPKIQSPYIWGANMASVDAPVILNGYVPDRDVREEIVAHAESLFQQRVVDRMVIATGVPEGDWADAVKSSLTTLASLETGRAKASDFEFRVTGTAPTQPAVVNAKAVMSGLGAGFDGAANLTVAPPPQVVEVDKCQALFDNAMRETTINFETSKAAIHSNSHALLDRLAVAAKQCSAFIVSITGHTDSVGASNLNQKLSEARAAAVVDYLVSSGVSAGRLKARGLGESEPIAENSTPQGRARNRRIEFTIEK